MINPLSEIKVIKKYQPRGYEIIYEDRDVIVGNKAAGFLTVSALWNKETTIHRALNNYIRKGQAKSNKRVYVVHRLDQATTGVLIFAKTPQAQIFLKDNWKETKKIYYTIVYGKMLQREGLISSHLIEDEEYMMHSVEDSGEGEGKLAQTAFKVIKESDRFSLLEIDLLTGRKNQIRVHLAQEGHPIVGDSKYGKHKKRYPKLALHSHMISFLHPHSKERLTFKVPVPDFFQTFVPTK